MHLQERSTPAGTCHACQYLMEDGVMADPSGLRSQDGSGYFFHDVATPGRRMGQLPLPFHSGPPAAVALRSHWPSRSTPVTVMTEGIRLPRAETRSLSAEKEAVLPSSEVEVKLERQSPFFGQ